MPSGDDNTSPLQTTVKTETNSFSFLSSLMYCFLNFGFIDSDVTSGIRLFNVFSGVSPKATCQQYFATVSFLELKTMRCTAGCSTLLPL